MRRLLSNQVFHFIAASGLFVAFLFTGAVWVVVVQIFPPGTGRAIAIFVLALSFSGLFLWLLFHTVGRIFVQPKRRALEAMLAAGYLVLLLGAFASVYQRIGIVDTTQRGHPVVTDFWRCLYFSVVTFTTVGYGDFYPIGVGRFLAGLEGLTGYVVLALLASTVASVLQMRSDKFNSQPPANPEGKEPQDPSAPD